MVFTAEVTSWVLVGFIAEEFCESKKLAYI